ncbi:hypothetical protein HMPREF2533_00370 [Bacteroides fragilis]|uniref:Uncharacterized protein n=1 Tax=Bacteroides fragilis (strain ATCC 25285 / DSM 2151 / CCUG 4856 / JCM 11019 / LMG 10263 / NCTC 9343 / Onslow / VPI 2553 / EN-2) TaxID=272559 RepID=Q5LGE2_BACFN|nr:hypothetical protein HMPREF2530_00370 [Bacteroides fragilis]KXU50462.1 hypothetical protein HMPREF2533_00370 [Bacteroides fragilis]CAH06798.1 hypothetical protein BF9343_1017 [Bacteroides fragilis NCTC 9343]
MQKAGKMQYNTYMQNNEIQQLAFIPTFCVLVKTEVVHKHLRDSILPAVLVFISLHSRR